MNFFEQLKQKPSHVKGQFAFVVATVVTAGIALVWSVSLPARFATIGEGINSVTGDNQANALDSVIQNSETQLGDVLPSDTSYEAGEPTFDETLYRNAYGEAPPIIPEEQMLPVGGTEITLPPPTPVEPAIETTQNEVKPVKEAPSNIILNPKTEEPSSPVLIPKGVQNPE